MMRNRATTPRKSRGDVDDEIAISLRGRDPYATPPWRWVSLQDDVTITLLSFEDDADGDGFPPPDDCDDFDFNTFPGAPELFDGQDNDCDVLVDEGLDVDGDGIPNFNDLCSDTSAGTGVDPSGCGICSPDPDDDLDGFPASVDCNDSDAAVNPGAAEACNEIDDDCDGLSDEGFDVDGDSFTVCAVPVADCDDADSAINPAAVELPGNSTDENCDGSLGGCDPNAEYKTHGHFIRCVAQEVDTLIDAGVISQEEGDALVKSAAKSHVGQ